jgi:hypothetical protein
MIEIQNNSLSLPTLIITLFHHEENFFGTGCRGDAGDDGLHEKK